jgi:phenylpropionate dioxygenase-like ring-hydroxylating dioxygenase large terminal subunit
MMSAEQPFNMIPVEEAAALQGYGPVPSRPYFDPAWWELERQAIFLRTWIHVGHVCEVPEPGSFIRRELEFANASLLIVRGKDGEVRAFRNTCTHRGTELVAEAAGKRAQFTCRYHSWTFGTNGRLLSAPDFERFHTPKEDCALNRVATEVVAGMIFVNFDPAPAQSARDFFGSIAEGMETLPVARAVGFTEWTYEIEANWKLNYDNFQENYHLRFIHPRTGASALAEENPFGYPSAYGFMGPHRSQTLWKNPNPPPFPPTLVLGASRGAQLAAKDGLAFVKTDFKLFPALHVVGLPPNQYTHTHYPMGPSRTRGQIRMYWTKETDSASRAFAREQAMMAVRDVLSEDRFAVEAGQRGISGIDKVYFQDHEVLPRHLYNEVVARVEAFVADRAAQGVAA